MVLVKLLTTHCPVRQEPEGSILTSAFQFFSAATKAGFKMDGARPEEQLLVHNRQVLWTASFVEELKLGLVACRLL
jgi:POT family proton-dependent oligopeptide transporter